MFELGEFTSIEVTDSAFGSGKYVKLRRHAIGNKRERWLNISKSALQAYKANEAIRVALMTEPQHDSETVYELSNNTFFCLSKYKGRMYFGFCQKTGVYKQTINLNNDEWDNLCSYMPQIENAIEVNKVAKRTHAQKKQEVPPKKKAKNTENAEKQTVPPKKKAKNAEKQAAPQKKSENTTADMQRANAGPGIDTCGAYELLPLHQYQWRLLKKGTTVVYVQDDDWTFSKEKAEREANENLDMLPSCEPELVVDIVNRVQILPQPLELLKIAYTYLAKKQAAELARAKCYGCVEDLCSQKDHMGAGGCLHDDVLAYYMSDVLMCLPVGNAIELIRKLCEKLNVAVPSFFQEPVPENIPTVTSGDIYTYSMLDCTDYAELFDSMV